ncbi:MAG: hypothetical protein AAGL98_07525 [Planctomycetota bacterium]
MNGSAPQPTPRDALRSLSPALRHDAPADAIVARALACVPPFQSWSHGPTPSAIERVLLELDEQELMTTAAVCLLRLVRLQHDQSDAA